MRFKLFSENDIIVKPHNTSEVQGHYYRIGICPKEAPSDFGMTARDAFAVPDVINKKEYKCHNCDMVLKIPETLEPYVKNLVSKASGNQDIRIFLALIHPPNIPSKHQTK